MKDTIIKVVRDAVASDMVLDLNYPNGHHLIDEPKAIRLIELCREEVLFDNVKIVLGKSGYCIKFYTPDDYYADASNHVTGE
jgi:hypothetical protein